MTEPTSTDGDAPIEWLRPSDPRLLTLCLLLSQSISSKQQEAREAFYSSYEWYEELKDIEYEIEQEVADWEDKIEILAAQVRYFQIEVERESAYCEEVNRERRKDLYELLARTLELQREYGNLKEVSLQLRKEENKALTNFAEAVERTHLALDEHKARARRSSVKRACKKFARGFVTPFRLFKDLLITSR